MTSTCPLWCSTPAFALRPHQRRDLIHRSRRVLQALGRRRQAGGVAHRGGLDRRLRAVEERVEHLRVEAADLRLLRRQAVVAPHRLRRRLREMRQPLVAAARRHHREAGGARPVHQIADQRRLVAVGEAVDHAGFRRLARQQRAAERIGLHRHHDDVLAVAERRQRVLHRRRRIAGGLDDDVDRRVRDQLLPIVGQDGFCPSLRACIERLRRRTARASSPPAPGSASHNPARGRRCRRDARPGVFGTCAMYIAANLPAPIRPMRSGLSLLS